MPLLPNKHAAQIEEHDQTCMTDVAPFDDGALLTGYDYLHDGFPPSAHSAAQHAATARPLPPGGQQHAQQQQQQRAQQASPAAAGPTAAEPAAPAGATAAAQPLQVPGGSPAANPSWAGLTRDDLRKLAYRWGPFQSVLACCPFAKCLGIGAHAARNSH